MGFYQVEFGVLLLFTVQLSTAQWYGMGPIQPPAGYYPYYNSLGQAPQWMQSVTQSGSPALSSLGSYQQIPSEVPVRQSVRVRCTETSVYVEVSKELFDANPALNVATLTLGGCAAKGVDVSALFLVYESELHGCNSKLTVSGNELVYTFTLGATSMPLSGTPILRSVGINLSIECHYPRFFNVSSSALMPAWIPYNSAQAAEDQLVFSLRLMSDDWTSERISNQYYLGDLINIEASVMQFHHAPLRVLVDGCVATANPDMNSMPRYPFIENYGCLIDSKLTQSSSIFVPQTQANKLQFRLEAFLFQDANSSLVYITCIVKAMAASAPPDAQNKACSFSDNRWIAAYGADRVCSCCDGICASRKRRDLSSNQDLQLKKKVNLGPIEVLENDWY